jgi:hypothetical protein
LAAEAGKELFELEHDRKWEYLSGYYRTAERVYGLKREVVSDEEVAARVKAFKEKAKPKIRTTIELKEWHFKADTAGEGNEQACFRRDYDESAWDRVRTPHWINHIPQPPQLFGRTHYSVLAPEEGLRWDILKADYTTWYKCRLRLDRDLSGRVAYLRVGGVNLDSDIWVNEMPVMVDHHGLFPFTVEVTDELQDRPDSEVVVTLRVRGSATNTPFFFGSGLQSAYQRPPYTQGMLDLDSLDQSHTGIAGEVTLSLVPPANLQALFVRTEKVSPASARLRCRIGVRNEGWQDFTGAVRIDVSRWFPEESARPARVLRRKVRLQPMSDAVLQVPFTLPKPDLWDTEHPHLYLCRAVLLDRQGKEIDDCCETFGVRTIAMRGAHFYLNNKKVILRGTHDLANYWQDSLICPSDRSIVRDILLSKKMGANCSRWPSDARMHYGRIAEYADQLGYMISWTGYFEMWTVHPQMELFAVRDVREMVRDLRNHPSIVVWEMGDEPLMLVHHRRRLDWYRQVYELVTGEDDTRPIIPAGWYCNELVELIASEAARSRNPRAARKRVLQDFPIFAMKNAPWDYHYCPTVPGRTTIPVRTVLDKVRDALQGERPTIFTEFGMDALPEPGAVRDVYGGFRWTGNQNWYVNKKTEDLQYYGRQIRESDWRETQAAQAVVLGTIVGYLREHPQDFAAFHFLSMFDGWIFYWGAVDAHGGAKLLYYVMRSCYAPYYVSAFHGSTVAPEGRQPSIKICNYGPTLWGAALEIHIKDREANLVDQQALRPLKVRGGIALSVVGILDLRHLPAGLYSAEYRLLNRHNEPLWNGFELFFVEG